MSFDGEKKKSESYTEDVVAARPTEDDSKLLADDIRRVAERKLVRKLDFRLMPAVVIIYLMNYIDRVAITSARLQGLEADLGLTDVQYDTVVAILYASYCPAQIPSNMILGYINRPSLYIGACVVAWGLTSALTGITTNFAGIIACRVFIGLPEAAFYPGSMYLLSRWYTKKELAFRSAIFYVGLLVSNAFGSGAVTMFVGLQTMWILPDFPHNTRWLNAAERRLAQVRLAEDAGEADQDAADTSIFDGFKLAIKDPK
ncbi:major facilitator superfamily domain-containing protein, partial [Hygrophoropsis aurantiaca]